MFGKRTKKTKSDQDRLDAIHDMPCMCCVIKNESQPFRTEAHHLVGNGYRRLSGGHQATIPLCTWHHRGVCLDHMTSSKMEAKYGPSLALSKSKFLSAYQKTELDMLLEVNKKIGLDVSDTEPATATAE